MSLCLSAALAALMCPAALPANSMSSVQPMIGEDGILSVAITPQVREQTGTVVTPDCLI